MALSRAAINCTEPCFPDSDYDFEDDDEFSIPAHSLPSGRKKKLLRQLEPSFDHSDYDFPYNDDEVSIPTFLPPSARTKKLAQQKSSKSTKKSKSRRRKSASSFGPIAGRDDDDESRIEGSVDSYATGSIYSDFRQGDEDEDDDASRMTFGSVPRLLNIKGDTITKQLTKAELSLDSGHKARAKKASEQEPDHCAKSIVSERSKTNKSTGIRKLPSQEERLVHSAKEARVKEFSEEELDSFGKNSLLDKERSSKTTTNVIEKMLSKGETAIEKMLSKGDTAIEKMLFSEKIFSAKNTEEEVGSLANDCSPEEGSNLKKSRRHDDGTSNRSTASSKRWKSKSKERNPPSIFDHVLERSDLKKSSGRDEGMSQRSVTSSKASKRSKSKKEQRDRLRDEDPPTKFDPVVEDKNTHHQSTENDLKPSVTWDLNPGTFRRVHTYAYPPDADSRRAHKRLLDLKMQETSQGGETKASQATAPDTKNETKLSKKTKDSILWWLPSLPSFGSFLGKDESEEPAGKPAYDKAKSKKELAKLAEGVTAFNTRHLTELVEKRRATADLDEVRANVEKIKASLNERKNQRTLVQKTADERMRKCLKVVKDGMEKQKAIEERMAKIRAKYTQNLHLPKPVKRKMSFRVAGLVDSPPVKFGMKTALEGSEEKQLKAAKSKEFDFDHWAREETEEVKIYSRPLRARRPINHQLKPFRDAWDDVVAVTEDFQSKLPTCA